MTARSTKPQAREVRIVGDVVIRPAKPWTATVHALLRHLRAQGLPVPEPIDADQSVERVRLVPGDAGQDAWPHQVDLAGVASAARLLRRIHDATMGWTPPPGAVWATGSRPIPEVICHGDPQPANFVWVGGRTVGLIDWDQARPGPRLDDVAYSLEWLAPFTDDPDELARRGLPGRPNRAARIAAFLEAYGWDEPIDVGAAVADRQRQAIAEVLVLGRAGHEPHATWVAQGWPERWQDKLRVTRELANQLSALPNPSWRT